MYFQSDRTHYKIFLKKIFQIFWLSVLFYFITTILVSISLRWIDPKPTSFIICSKFNQSKQTKNSSNVQFSWINFEKISPFAGLAVIAAEDQKFLEHSGFDFESIEKARKDYANGKRLRGASTITQQVAKNLFLWQEDRKYLQLLKLFPLQGN